MSSPLRIAILECDTPVPEVHKRYNGYGGVFSTLLKSSAKTLHLDPETDLEITAFNIVDDDKYPKLEDVDAILLSGSKHNSFEDHPWILRLVEFTKMVLAQDRVRILGICFGHQIIGRALDSKVGRSDKGWEISVCDMDLTDKGKELFGREKLRIQQMHQDIVFSLPPGVVSLGSSPRCEVQGMYAAGRFITVQGHPEFNGEIITEIVKVRSTGGIFTEEMAKDADDRAFNEQDGIAIGAVFLKFLLEE